VPDRPPHPTDAADASSADGARRSPAQGLPGRNEEQRLRLGLVVDAVMLVLIVANLALIVLDAAFGTAFVQNALYAYLPRVARWYERTIHDHFVVIDLAFVAVFAAEIMVRWGIAIARQTYHRWFFYPFVHWYDVLGCIPIGSFRALRVLRVFALVPKLQRLGFFDLRATYLYRTFAKYRAILVEEVTDRVTVRLLDGVQTEIERNQPVIDAVVREVIVPRRAELVAAVTHRLQEATSEAYGSFQTDFRGYVDRVIAEAVNQNREISTIALVPGLGTTVAGLLESAIADIVYTVIDRMMADIGARESDDVIGQITAISTDALLASKSDDELKRLVRVVLIESIDRLKDHVQVKQWKLDADEAPRPPHHVPPTNPEG
jgi:hypothetical protein